jgi:spermidine synthase
LWLGEEMHSFGDSLQQLVLRAGMILFLPAVFLGATVPLATEIVARQRAGIGRSVGRVYGVNTVGAIAGALAASFLLIPGLGMQDTLVLLVAINLALAAALVLVDLRSFAARLVASGVAAALLLSLLVGMPDDVFRRTFVGSSGQELVFYREGATDTVGVVEHDGQRRIVYEDQRGTAATWSYSVNYLFGHLPLLLHPGRPEKALHICFGVGNSLSAMAAHDTIERVDSVELSPHVLEAADYFWTNAGVIHHPRVRTVIDDGRNFVMASDEIYDVIALEPPDTFTAGVINLYTREFYRDAARRLADDGVLVQWIPVGEGPLHEEKMLFRAFHDVFPNATVWQQLTRDGNILLVGTKQPLRIDYQLLQEKMSQRRVRRDLELSGVNDAVDVLSMFVFGSRAFAEFVDGVEPVVDDRTVLDFSMPRYLGSGFGMGSLRSRVSQDGRHPMAVIRERTLFYHRARRSVVPLLTNLGDADRAALERAIRERKRPSNSEVLVPIPESEWNRWPDDGPMDDGSASAP